MFGLVCLTPFLSLCCHLVYFPHLHFSTVVSISFLSFFYPSPNHPILCWSICFTISLKFPSISHTNRWVSNMAGLAAGQPPSKHLICVKCSMLDDFHCLCAAGRGTIMTVHHHHQHWFKCSIRSNFFNCYWVFKYNYLYFFYKLWALTK